MIAIRKHDERGHARFGWLDSRHSFSFGDYYDPKQMGFRSLRVINEDRVQPGRGFDPHSHRDMEIVSYVLEGALEHRDSLGTGSVIWPGDVQLMSAGTGITHSEFNPSRTEPVHFLQIWIRPARGGLAPGYEQKSFDPAGRRGRLQLVADAAGRDGALTIHQDMALYACLLAHNVSTRHDFAAGRHGWLQVARGAVAANGVELRQGDGAAISGESSLTITGADDSEVLLFDLA